MSKQEGADEIVSMEDIIASIDLNPQNTETETAEQQEEVEEQSETEVSLETESTNLLEAEEVKEEKVFEPKINPVFEETKSLLKRGLLEDIRVQISEDDEEGVKLSELEDITEDQLKTVIESIKADKDSSIKEKYISKEKLSEDALKIVKILESGGQMSDIFEKPQDAIRPFQGVDLEDKKIQAKILYDNYTQEKGLTHKETMSLLQNVVNEQKLEEKSLEVYKKYNDLYDQNLEAKSQQALEKAQERQRAAQQNRKSLKETLIKEQFKDAIANKFLDAVTKPNQSGKLEIEEKFQEILNNPAENYQKLLYIFDEKAFDTKYKTTSQKKEESKLIKILRDVPKAKSTELSKNNAEIGSSLFEQIENINLK